MESPGNHFWEEQETLFRAPELSVDTDILMDLQTLQPRLSDLGYSELEISRCLKVSPFTARRFLHIPAYRRRLRDHGLLGTAISFWLLQDYVELEQLRACIGDHALAALHRLGWLGLGAQGVRSRVDLYPCKGHLFFTDAAYNLQPWAEQVYWLDQDSYTLAYSTPRRPRARSLDICTGSGIHAVLAGSHSSFSLGVDVNPRALSFSRLNADFNRLGEVHFRASDCYAETGSQAYDLITLNPPFVPTPEDISELYRTGGESGESVTERVVRGLHEHLAPGGLFSMVTQAPLLADSNPLERMQQWLGPGWGVAILHHQDFLLEGYILAHAMETENLPPQEQVREYERWLDCYAGRGIQGMMAGQFFALRLPEGSSGWSRERRLDYPDRDRSGQVQEWLESLQSWHEPIPGDFRPRVHHSVRRLYFSDDAVAVEFVDAAWSQGLASYGPAAAAALRAVVSGAHWSELEPHQAAMRELGCDLVVSRPAQD